jgi:hypothetical protein
MLKKGRHAISRRVSRGWAIPVSMMLVIGLMGTALGAVTFDPATGTGFVGKGDVQLVYGWNNKQLQDNADKVDFQVSAVSETTWTCSRPAPTPNDPDREIVQERSQTTTTQGIVTSVARENSKGKLGPVTGFILDGYEGEPTVTSDGPNVGSCPANPSGFTYDENAETTSLGGGLQVSTDGENWFELQS